jgi:hypothetical protein
MCINSYRKYILEEYLTENKQQLALFFVYTNKEEMDYEVLFKKTETLFKKLITEFSKLDA